MKKRGRVGILIISLIVVVGVFLFFSYFFSVEGGGYRVQEDTIHYAKTRGKTNYKINFWYENNDEDVEVYTLNFRSRDFMQYGIRIYGLLFLPVGDRGDREVPGLVLLPGGGGTKEGQADLATLIAKEGYAVLVIDQRGIGETGGHYLNTEEDYQVFLQGNEPIQHLSVYDALRSFDVLREIDIVDKDNIAIMGLSMGGRYAIIATALDRRLKGVIGISVSGFNAQKDPNNLSLSNYLLSIDPDHYIYEISPRPVIMIHDSNDDVVPLSSAQSTFRKAGDPKEFYIVDSCPHGYCDNMYGYLRNGLKSVFK